MTKPIPLLFAALMAMPAHAQPVSAELPPIADGATNSNQSPTEGRDLDSPSDLQHPGIDSYYEVSGSREVRPISIRDDGLRTYLIWSPSQSLPSVFAVDRKGREEVINGYMRGDEFTLDRVYDRIVFRMDTAIATARRRRGEPR